MKPRAVAPQWVLGLLISLTTIGGTRARSGAGSVLGPFPSYLDLFSDCYINVIQRNNAAFKEDLDPAPEHPIVVTGTLDLAPDPCPFLPQTQPSLEPTYYVDYCQTMRRSFLLNHRRQCLSLLFIHPGMKDLLWINPYLAHHWSFFHATPFIRRTQSFRDTFNFLKHSYISIIFNERRVTERRRDILRGRGLLFVGIKMGDLYTSPDPLFTEPLYVELGQPDPSLIYLRSFGPCWFSAPNGTVQGRLSRAGLDRLHRQVLPAKCTGITWYYAEGDSGLSSPASFRGPPQTPNPRTLSQTPFRGLDLSLIFTSLLAGPFSDSVLEPFDYSVHWKNRRKFGDLTPRPRVILMHGVLRPDLQIQTYHFFMPTGKAAFNFATCDGLRSRLSFGNYAAAYQASAWLAGAGSFLAFDLALRALLKYGGKGIEVSPVLLIVSLLLEVSFRTSRRLEGWSGFRAGFGPLFLMVVILSNAYKGISITDLLAPIPKTGFSHFRELLAARVSLRQDPDFHVLNKIFDGRGSLDECCRVRQGPALNTTPHLNDSEGLGDDMVVLLKCDIVTSHHSQLLLSTNIHKALEYHGSNFTGGLSEERHHFLDQIQDSLTSTQPDVCNLGQYFEGIQECNGTAFVGPETKVDSWLAGAGSGKLYKGKESILGTDTGIWIDHLRWDKGLVSDRLHGLLQGGILSFWASFLKVIHDGRLRRRLMTTVVDKDETQLVKLSLNTNISTLFLIYLICVAADLLVFMYEVRQKTLVPPLVHLKAYVGFLHSYFSEFLSQWN